MREKVCWALQPLGMATAKLRGVVSQGLCRTYLHGPLSTHWQGIIYPLDETLLALAG